MFHKKEDGQTCGILANRSKKYVTPCISIIAVETATLLAGSGPEASVEDISYGGDLTGEIDDQ
ncbi:hypothetical protein [Prevotella jejuni]|jgi:hypothetical protein|uniref:hypothetical protein n=1 Tax=Prevotella jejuni TaxID=1177574 RepID=UPI001C5FE7AB|nr:hypothetical protein [Prevotella jejuni]MBW4772398.1 hypothetical protein [Prevotella jejuni]